MVSKLVCPTSMALARSDVFQDVSLTKPRMNMYTLSGHNATDCMDRK